MTLSRCGGVLLHPTSLPGRCGIGDLGKNAHRFVDFLHRAGLNLWQILPLSPTGYGNSPYQALSTFAGNPLWISLEKLVEDELLAPGDLNHAADFPALKVDFAKVTAFHSAITTRAFEKYSSSARHSLKAAFETFCHNNHNWLEEYALFRALKSIHKECAWVEWPIELVHRKPSALNVAADKLAREIETIKFQQFLFFRQWDELRAYAKEKGVRIVGDVPIFVAHDSVDVWTNQHLFHLDKTGRPTHVAGVPPDYFSETGQLWGNPLYDWRKMSEDNYAWWVSRMKSLFSLVDIIRLDHFRGFEAYWSVPAEEETAINGQWLKGPGFEFFDELVAQIGELPIIAEDLGVITEEVEALRDHYGFPGMKVLQFAFGDTDAANAFLPYNYERNCVVYTGTHDNDATISWFKGESESTDSPKVHKKQVEHALKYLGTTGENIHWDFIRLAFSSVANLAIVPMQDVLGLGKGYRMNMPGSSAGNWEWRFEWEQLTDDVISKLTETTALYGRKNVT